MNSKKVEDLVKYNLQNIPYMFDENIMVFLDPRVIGALRIEAARRRLPVSVSIRFSKREGENGISIESGKN